MNCRICDAETVPFVRISIDELDEPFLDAILRQRLPELKLHRCAQCHSLWAVDGRKDDNIIADAYQRVGDAYFDSPNNDPRYVKFYKNLEQLVKPYVVGRAILDVGCGDGVFLATISNDWCKRGIEPSASGVRLARQKKLAVDQATLDTSAREYQADLISALDVIEHVIDPHGFMDSLKQHLRPGGGVLLLTGDADSYPARIAGPQWSYLRWCGHISVFSQSGLRKLLEAHGFEVVAWTRCEHPSSSGALAWWRVHALEPARRVLGRNRSWYPFWRDHQAVVARLQ